MSISVGPELAIASSAGEHRSSHYVIVVIRTNKGLSGIGEANVAPAWSGESQGSAIAAIRDLVAPVLVGRDPLEISSLLDAMDRVLIGNPFTKAAIEIALFDLVGKALRVPVYALLGGPRRSPEIPLRFSIGAFPPSNAARVAERAMAMGLAQSK